MIAFLTIGFGVNATIVSWGCSLLHYENFAIDHV